MKTTVTAFLIYTFITTSAFAVCAIEFSPGTGSWIYTGTTGPGPGISGTLTFSQTIFVDRGLGSATDNLVGAVVNIPVLDVSGTVGGPFTVTPQSSTITITNAVKTVTYLSGTLGSEDLIPPPLGKSTGGAYTFSQVDITNIMINNAIASNALAAIDAMAVPVLDFDLSLNGAEDLMVTLDMGGTTGDGFSGSMTIPEPATLLLLSFGGLLLRRRIHRGARRERRDLQNNTL
jgi:hypothetical protein